MLMVVLFLSLLSLAQKRDPERKGVLFRKG